MTWFASTRSWSLRLLIRSTSTALTSWITFSLGRQRLTRASLTNASAVRAFTSVLFFNTVNDYTSRRGTSSSIATPFDAAYLRPLSRYFWMMSFSVRATSMLAPMQKQATFDSCVDYPVSDACGSIPTRQLSAGAEQVARSKVGAVTHSGLGGST